MIKVLAIVCVASLFLLFIVLTILNKKTKAPDGLNKITPERCASCNVSECALRGEK